GAATGGRRRGGACRSAWRGRGGGPPPPPLPGGGGSLDSMVLGEPQILGQVKDAYDAAIAAGALRSHLSRCVSRAFSVAKRIRTETQLGAGTVSISSVAVDLAKRIFGELADHTVLLVGAGEMAAAAAKSLGQQ